MVFSKVELRQLARQARDAIGDAQRVRHSDEITRHALSLAVVERAARVMVYASIGSEVGTELLMRELLAAGKVVSVPVVESTPEQPGLMQGYRIASLDELLADRFGVPALMVSHRTLERRVDHPEVVLVPGLAFDGKSGARLGMGGGFYDRYLGGRPDSLAVGLAFSEQVIEGVPVEPHDVLMRELVTPTGVLELGKPGVSR